MSVIGETLNPTKINYDMRKFKTDLRANDAKNNHPLMRDHRGKFKLKYLFAN